MGRKPSPSTAAVWRERLARFGECQLTVKEFCRREGVSEPSFYHWRKRLDRGRTVAKQTRRSGGEPTKAIKSLPFLPVKVSSAGDDCHTAFNAAWAEVELPDGLRIRVPATHSEALRVVILTGHEVCREVR
jgi:hypothetical protein